VSSPLDNAEMAFGFDRTGYCFCAGWIVDEWGGIKQFKRDHKPFKIEVVKPDSVRCAELMELFKHGAVPESKGEKT